MAEEQKKEHSLAWEILTKQAKQNKLLVIANIFQTSIIVILFLSILFK